MWAARSLLAVAILVSSGLGWLLVGEAERGPREEPVMPAETEPPLFPSASTAFEPLASGAFVVRTEGGLLWAAEGKLILASGGNVSFLHFDGARLPVAEGPMPGVFHYLVGSPEEWRTDVPRFERVRYEAVAPGVDLVVYVTEDQGLEFDFLVAPGADPDAARFTVEGPAIHLRSDGSLDIAGTTLEPPRSFQRPAGADENEIPSWFELAAAPAATRDAAQSVAGATTGLTEGMVRTEVRIRVAGYDATLPLRIDPRIEWATYAGGGGNGGYGSDRAAPPAVLPDGDILVAGTMYSQASAMAGVPVAPGSYDATPNGWFDAFVSRFDPDGQLEWGTFFGTSEAENAFAVDVYPDMANWGEPGRPGIVLLGLTGSDKMPTTPDAWQTTRPDSPVTFPYGESRSWLAIFSDDGDTLHYATALNGASAQEYIRGLDVQGFRIALGGFTGLSGGWPTTVNAYRPAPTQDSHQTTEAVVAVIDPRQPSAQQAIYSTYFGSSLSDRAWDVAFTPDGDVVAVGEYAGGAPNDPFPTRGAGGQAPLNGDPGSNGPKAWVARFDPDAQDADASLVYATFLPTSASAIEEARAVDVDGAGNAILVGYTTGHPLAGLATGHRLTPTTDQAALVAVVDPDGTSLVAGTYFEGMDGPDCVTFWGGSDCDHFDAVTWRPSDGATIVSGMLYDPGDPDYTDPVASRNQPWQKTGDYTRVAIAFEADLDGVLYRMDFGGTGADGYQYPGTTPTSGHALLPDGHIVLAHTSGSGDASVTSGAFSTTLRATDVHVVKTALLPPVPIIHVTHDVLPDTLTTRGTVQDATHTHIHSFSGLVTSWSTDPAKVPYTYTEYTLDASLGHSRLGDVGDGSLYTWAWDLDNDGVYGDDDADAAAGGSPVHVVNQTTPGTRRYCVEVADEDQNSAATCVDLHWRNRPPTARFTTVPDAADLPVCTQVTLDASSSFDLDAAPGTAPGITKYEWDLDADAGPSVDATGPTASLIVDETGTRRVVLTVTDADGATGTSERVLSFTGAGVRAYDDAYDVTAGLTLDVATEGLGVLGNDCSLGEGTLTARLVSSVPWTAGTFAMETNGTFTYAAHRDYEGTLLLVYEALDAEGRTDSANITIEVWPRNGRPEAGDDQWIDALEDTSTTFTLDAEDAEDTALTYELLSTVPGLRGTPPALTYKGPEDFCHPEPDGNVSFQYRAYDSDGRSDTGTVRIHVGCVPDPPLARDDVFAVTPAETRFVHVTANDADPDSGGPLTVVAVTQGEGEVTIHNATHVRYVAPDATMVDGFTYTIRNEAGLTATASVRMAVYDVADNTGPHAPVHRWETVSGTGRTFTFSAVDDDPPETLTYGASPDLGLMTIDGDQAHYTAPDQCPVQDRFSYTVADPAGIEAEGLVVVTVVCPPRPPVLTPDEATMAEDAVILVDVLANDSDPDGDALRIVGTSGEGTHWSVDGLLAYQPPRDAQGTFVLTYEATDGSYVGSSTLTVHVESRPDAPRAAPDHAGTDEEQPVLVDVLVNDADPDGDAVALTGSSAGTITPDGILYTPGPDFSGTATFTYTISDGTHTATGLVTVEVLSIDDPPHAQADQYTTRSGETLHIAAPGVLGNDVDVDSPLQSSLQSPPEHGRVTLGPDGSFVYVPAPGHVGTDAFSYAAIGDHAVSLGWVTVHVERPRELFGAGPQRVDADASGRDTLALPEVQDTTDGPLDEGTQDSPPALDDVPQGDIQVAEGARVVLEPPGAWVQTDGIPVRLVDGAFEAPAVSRAEALTFGLAGASLRVIVLDSNQPPILTTRPLEGWVGEKTALFVAAEDPDGDTLEYRWSQVDGPAAELSSLAAVRPVLRPTLAGDHVFAVTVSDGLQEATARVTLRVARPIGMPDDFTAAPVGTGWWLSAPHVDGVRYEWQLPDGRLEGREVLHSFEAPGPHAVVLHMEGPKGEQRNVTKVLTSGTAQDAPSLHEWAPDSGARRGWAAAAVVAVAAAFVATAWHRRRQSR